jgi:hypothetical protein
MACVGCSQPPDAELVPVSGRVFLGDTPLAFGTVIFQPQAGQAATGKIEPDGRFSLSTNQPDDGALVGRHRVRVMCYSSQDPSRAGDGSQGDSLGELLIPQRYTALASSGIEVMVLAGGNAPFIIKLEPEPPAEVTPSEENVDDNVADQPATDDTATDEVPEQSNTNDPTTEKSDTAESSSDDVPAPEASTEDRTL